jgi:hypothetical protein
MKLEWRRALDRKGLSKLVLEAKTVYAFSS